MAKVLKKKNIQMAPIDPETVEKIKRISKATGSNSISVINTAIQVLEKSLGRQIIVRSEDENWDLAINHFKKYGKVVDINPK